jgi:predicted flap endonuclease-1-like 5' DNA nuclease
MASIIDVEGIGPVNAEKLAEVFVKTTDKLLEIGGTRKGRQGLSEQTGIPEKTILEWVNLADLFRIKGIGEEFSDLLEASGVDTVVELALRVPENLHKKIIDVNSKKNLVRRLPTLTQIKDFIEQAKKLNKAVYHEK